MIVYSNRNCSRAVRLTRDVMPIQRSLTAFLTVTGGTDGRFASTQECFRSRFSARALRVFPDTTPSYRLALMRSNRIASWKLPGHSHCPCVKAFKREHPG